VDETRGAQPPDGSVDLGRAEAEVAPDDRHGRPGTRIATQLQRDNNVLRL